MTLSSKFVNEVMVGIRFIIIYKVSVIAILLVMNEAAAAVIILIREQAVVVECYVIMTGILVVVSICIRFCVV